MYRPPELSSLREELRGAGLFEHRELRSWAKLALLLAGVAACLVAIASFGIWAAIAAVPVAAVLCTSAAMLGHEGSHRSFSSSAVRNDLMKYLTFPLFTGLSSLYWHDKHDRLHHGHPNVEGRDPDIKPFPFVSSRGDHDRCGRGERWFQRTFQRWLFWPMSGLMAVGMRRSSLLHVMRYPKQHGITREWILDSACIATHYTAWLVVPSFVWGPLATFLVYTAIWGLVGPCLALVFAPAHMGLPIMAEQHTDWLHQLETTRNLELPRFVSFFFIGLDYQVEHHLFPRIPHQNLPRAAAITADWCARQGVPHLSMPYFAALADSARFIAAAWQREASDPDAVRASSLGNLAAGGPSS